jgi:hypothetical protein
VSRPPTDQLTSHPAGLSMLTSKSRCHRFVRNVRWLIVAVIMGSATISTAENHQPLNSVLGAYFFPNPGSGGNPDFDQQFDAFSAALGTIPVARGVFGDNSHGMTNLAGSQYWNVNPLKVDPRTKGGKVTPLIGLAMAANEDRGNDNAILQRFSQIADGTYDQQLVGIINAWKNGGFKRIVVRVGYEMNGHWMAWAVPGGKKLSAWNAAFHRVSTVMKAHAGEVGLDVAIAWNPCLVTGEDVPTDAMYPGDEVVDIISLDIYSSVSWTKDRTNWDAGGKLTGTAPDLKSWAASADNRRHFWLYPDGTRSDPTGTRGSGWGLAKHIAFAKAHKKPIAISETGVGSSPGAPETGVDDDGELPKLLWEQLRTYPYGIDHVVVWSLDEGDFRGNFLDNTKWPHPLAKAAWRKYFGDGR